MAYKVFISKPAENDMLDIVQYISSILDAPVTASKMLDNIINAVDSLNKMPYGYQLVDDERLSSLGYRKMPVKNYFIFFTIDEKNRRVIIERILYARRDWKHFL